MEKMIITGSDTNDKGIIGVVTEPYDYPPYTHIFEVTDLNGNTESGKQIGDKFDVFDGEFAKYYPSDVSKIDILKEQLESLKIQRELAIQMVREEEGHQDRLDFIETVEIPRIEAEIRKAEEEEQKQNVDNIKDKNQSGPLTIEMFKEMFKTLLQSKEIQFVTDEVKTNEERSFRTKVLVDGEVVYENKQLSAK